ncbi:MAG: acyltransferase [Lactobacillales bacterium]|nr:acyltransferase [Lactobacillales bacterium]
MLKKILFKILFNKQLIGIKNLNFRKRFQLTIDRGQVIFGRNVFFNNDCSIHSVGKINIGNDCIFGENVKIYDHNHIFKSKLEPIRIQGLSHGNVEIGNNVWVGTNVVILSGSKIGSNVVVGAGNIISGIIPDNSIVKKGKIEKWR